MKQLEAKIETGKHNLKIKRDKDLIVLQKQINLHVHDIERIQGMMTIEALNKGEKADELRRIKDKSRKTQAFLSESKKVQSSTIKAAGQDSTKQDGSMKQTMMSGTGATGGQQSKQNIMVDLLLFGQSAMQKKGLMSSSMNNSFQNTMSSSMGHANQV